jgi:tRNA-splicing ligase RtcB (3'-phosphate/5'-hydroxy nucleic acid ligase)
MNCAANYAWANRQVLTYRVREAFEDVLAGHVRDCDLSLVYDVAHNMAKIETHEVGGRSQQVCVHRKGATRAFGPGHPDVPEDYRHRPAGARARQHGHGILRPGGHGGRDGPDFRLVLSRRGPGAQPLPRPSARCAGSAAGPARARWHCRARGQPGRPGRRSPAGYKDVDQVVAVVEAAGLARIVARLEPLAVIKG